MGARKRDFMSRIFSNGPNDDPILNPFIELVKESPLTYLAAPYFTEAKPMVQELVNAAKKGNRIRLLIGLNEATSPKALRIIHEESDISVRYLTSRFHAKIYVFEKAALLGSANLTNGGLRANREAVIMLDREFDTEVFEEVRTLFKELWETGQVLTGNVLDVFEKAHRDLLKEKFNSEEKIVTALKRVKSHNFNIDKHGKSKERVFVETLRREVDERYLPAFSEVKDILKMNSHRRPELAGIGIELETNRFLNYVRLTHVVGDQVWQSAEPQRPEERQKLIVKYAKEWIDAVDSKVPVEYLEWLEKVRYTFESREAIKAADEEQIMDGLKSLHAFHGQSRFVKGGLPNLQSEFMKSNNDDIDHVKMTISHLLYGPGDFIQRLHDVLYDKSWKLKRFGKFSALELYGTIKPKECPPMNGRMAKALRFLGFDVEGS